MSDRALRALSLYGEAHVFLRGLAVQLGFKTILVLSGGTSRHDLTRYAYRPDMVADSIADLHHARLVHEFSATQHLDVDESAPALAAS